MPANKNQLSTQNIKSFNATFWKIVIGLFLIFALIIVSVGLGIFGELPSFRDLENPKSNLASSVISEDKVELGTYFVQNRSNIRYQDLSPNLVNTLIATEDIRFKDHSGIDFKRTFTILFYNLIGKKQGASTITQQLALNLFSEKGREKVAYKRIVQKMQELVIAIKLERNYTKEEIMTMYLNTVDFGNNAFGIKSAAKTYFNTTPDAVTPEQAAVLIGLLKGPTLYSPVRNPDRSLARRNLILQKMGENNFITDEVAATAKAKPLGLKFRPMSSNGSAAYFRSVLKRDIQRAFREQSITKADGTPYDLDRDGLKIYTSINSKMQDYAEEAQKEYMKTLQAQFKQHWKNRDPFKGMMDLLTVGMKRSERYQQLKAEGKSTDEIWADFRKPAKMQIFSWRGKIDTVMRPLDSIKYTKMILRNAMMSMDPKTGYVKAWVGGIDFENFKYDQVKMGTRQVGSTAKPFTYATAMYNGFSPCYEVLNEPVTVSGYGAPWSPGQSKPLPGYLTLRKAMANSQNWVTAFVMREVGPVAVSTLTKKMGITSDVPPYPSIALGTYNASIYDMTGAYSTFVNHGVWTEPIYLLRIEDKNGNVLYEKKPRIVVALDEQTAYVMTYMLKGVVDEGTGWRLRRKYGITNPVGGKTGTTQNNSDGWFMGITPQLVTGVWTGCEDRAIHFRSTDLGEGANTALPIFAMFMKKVYADASLGIKKGDFEQPKSGVTTTLDCGKYRLEAAPEAELDEKLGF